VFLSELRQFLVSSEEITAHNRAAAQAICECSEMIQRELALAEHIATGRAGRAVKAGQELRFLDLEADAGSGLGVWSQLAGVSAADMSDQVRAAAQADFGHAGLVFVGALQSGDLDQLKAAARMTHRAFIDQTRRRLELV
jgi:hypothetical protein